MLFVFSKKLKSLVLSLGLMSAFSLTSCSSESILNYLLQKQPRSSHPGHENQKGEVVELSKNQYGEWQGKRKYSEDQKEQLKAWENR